MTDDLTPTTEDVVEPSTEEGTPSHEPEETQDVGALKRALDRERGERREAKEELRRIREDEDARRELLAEWGYEVTEPDEDPDDDDDELDDPPGDPRVDQLVQWQQERERERRVNLFEADLKEVVGEREVSGPARDWIAFQTSRGGDNRKALEKAVKDWFEYEDQLRQSGQEQLRQSKKAPHVTPGGKAGSGPQHDLDTSEGRSAFFRDRLGQQP